MVLGLMGMGAAGLLAGIHCPPVHHQICLAPLHTLTGPCSLYGELLAGLWGGYSCFSLGRGDVGPAPICCTADVMDPCGKRLGTECSEHRRPLGQRLMWISQEVQ